MGLFEIYQARALRHSNQDKGRRRIAKIAEPLVTGLLPGKNYVTGRDFYALSRFLLADEVGVDWEGIDKRGAFSIGRIEVVIDTKASQSWLTASEIATMVGLKVKHLEKLLKAANVSFRTERKARTGRPRKLYDFVEIKTMRLTG
jgi:hypothetical protein